MVWTQITSVEPSAYGDDSKLIIFDYLGEVKHSVITSKVLQYHDITEFKIGDKVYIVKSYNKNHKPIYLIRKVKK